MNILYVSPNAEFGGAERIVETLVRFHDKNKHRIFVVFLKDGPLVSKWQALGAEVYVARPFKFRNIFSLFMSQIDFGRYLSQNKIDLVHSTMAYGHIFAGPVCLFKGVPEVWFQHGPVGSYWDKFAGLITSKAIFYNSKYTYQLQLDLAFFKKSSSTQIPDHKLSKHFVVYGPSFLNEQSPEERKISREKVRKEFGILDSDFLYVHVARIEPWKGQLEFIQAFKAVTLKNNNVKALIVGGSNIGDTQYETKIRETVNTLGLESMVSFTGQVSEVAIFYFAADCFVHSSIIGEPLGLTILEAMHSGLPVIVSDGGGPKELIESKKNGLLTKMGDTLDLIDAMILIKENGELRATVGENAKTFALQFASNVWVKGIEKLYETLLPFGGSIL